MIGDNNPGQLQAAAKIEYAWVSSKSRYFGLQGSAQALNALLALLRTISKNDEYFQRQESCDTVSLICKPARRHRLKLRSSTPLGMFVVKISGKTVDLYWSTRLLTCVTGIKAHTLPKVGIPKRMAKYFVKVVVDGDIKLTTVAKRGKTVSWAENIYMWVFYLDVILRLTYELAMRITIPWWSARFTHSSRSGVNTLSVDWKRVSSRFLLPEVRFLLFTEQKYALNHPPAAITRKLCKYDKNGNLHELETVVEFTIASIAGPAGAAQTQMDDAVAQGQIAHEEMKHIPSSSGPAVGVVDESIAVFNNVKPVAEIWSPFLQKVEWLTALVDEISEVRHATRW
jgi:hypothetical protein